MSEIEVEFGLSDSDISERAKVADKVNALISDKIPGNKNKIKSGMRLQWGLEFRMLEIRTHLKSERFHVLYWDGSVFERSERCMVFRFQMAVSLDRFLFI